jgi:hypothetical protein
MYWKSSSAASRGTDAGGPPGMGSRSRSTEGPPDAPRGRSSPAQAASRCLIPPIRPGAEEQGTFWGSKMTRFGGIRPCAESSMRGGDRHG